jgi:hypothetical protein
MKKHVIGYTAATLLALGIGLSAGSSGSTATPVATPTVTVTDTQTETATAAPTTPQACLDAIDDGAKLADIYARFTQSMSGYPEQTLKAAQAGANSDSVAIGEVTAWMNQNTAEVHGYSQELAALKPKLGSDVNACRSGS